MTAPASADVTAPASDYVFAEAVRLRVRGSRRALRHFDAEYGECGEVPSAEPDVDVDVRFGLRVPSFPGGVVVAGGHKTARWRVSLGPPDARPLRASIALSGGPPSFALSLVQGYFVEALVSLALARAGRVALPSAAFADGGGATVLLGRSGAGKTTLTARVLALGRTVLSDDQVVLDAAGRAWRYPRRLRFYPDIRETAPGAWSLLAPRTRATLAVRDRVRRLSRGFVAPSLAVPVSELGPTVSQGPLPVQRVVVVGRSAVDGLIASPRTSAWAVEQAGSILAAQRARMAQGVHGGWAYALDAALECETATLAAATADLPATEIVIPRAWSAVRAVDELGTQLGLW